MKKFIAVLAGIVVASVAYANVWNIKWGIMDALSPEDMDGDESPLLMADYSVTWSLVYGDNVSVAADGTLVGASLIDSMEAAAGATSMGWTDGPRSGTYTQKLSGMGTYYGSTGLSTPQSVYQYIFISGTSGDYYWLSDVLSVTPGDPDGDTPLGPPKGWDPELEIGPVGGTSEYQTDSWTKVSSQPTIPEPATMSLLGLGALAMVLRRKLRK